MIEPSWKEVAENILEHLARMSESSHEQRVGVVADIIRLAAEADRPGAEYVGLLDDLQVALSRTDDAALGALLMRCRRAVRELVRERSRVR